MKNLLKKLLSLLKRKPRDKPPTTDLFVAAWKLNNPDKNFDDELGRFIEDYEEKLK